MVEKSERGHKLWLYNPVSGCTQWQMLKVLAYLLRYPFFKNNDIEKAATTVQKHFEFIKHSFSRLDEHVT